MLGKDSNIIYTKKLLEHTKFFKDFENIDTEKLNRELELIKKRIENYSTTECSNELANKYFSIIRTIYFAKRLTIDEKIYIIINYLDPELNIANTYNSYNIPSNNDINNESSTQEKIKLKIKRELLEKKFSDYLFNSFGTRSNFLLIYELKYIKAFSTKLSFINDNKAYKYLLSKKDELDNYEISNERLNYIINKSTNYRNKYPEFNIKALGYQLINQNEYFNLKDDIEKLIFMIITIDPSLLLNKIYEESNKWDEIKEESKNLVGTYNKELVLAENKFIKHTKKQLD